MFEICVPTCFTCGSCSKYLVWLLSFFPGDDNDDGFLPDIPDMFDDVSEAAPIQTVKHAATRRKSGPSDTDSSVATHSSDNSATTVSCSSGTQSATESVVFRATQRDHSATKGTTGRHPGPLMSSTPVEEVQERQQVPPPSPPPLFLESSDVDDEVVAGCPEAVIEPGDMLHYLAAVAASQAPLAKETVKTTSR